LAKSQSFKTTQEPELFQGVLLKDNGMVCFVEEDGSIFINGASSIAQANAFARKLDDELA
jgi:TATA-box binding protein (TBP) (component of TFIID and TFIIIB)